MTSTAFVVVKVHPRSKSPGVEEVGDGTLRVRVLAPPEKGRANREVIKRLAVHMNIPPSRLHIVRGETSSRKTIRIG